MARLLAPYAFSVLPVISAVSLAVDAGPVFDTLRIRLDAEQKARIVAAGLDRRINLRHYQDGLGVSLDETCGAADIQFVYSEGNIHALGPAITTPLYDSSTGSCESGSAIGSPVSS